MAGWPGLHPCGLVLISERHLGAGSAGEYGAGHPIQIAMARPVLSPAGSVLSLVGNSGYKQHLLSQEGQEKPVLEKTSHRARPFMRTPGPRVQTWDK